MSVYQDLKSALEIAVRAKDELGRETLRTVLSAVSYKQIDKKDQLSDQEVHVVLKSELKKRQESIPFFKKGGRQDLVDRADAEIKIIAKFLPAMMSEEEIKTEVEKILAEKKDELKDNLGRAIGMVIAELKGRADGGMVARLVKKYFTK